MARASNISSFKASEVDSLFKDGKRVYCDSGILVICKKPGLGRVLPVVSRKRGSAPKRNQFKRRVRAIFYEAGLKDLKIDCIVLARSGLAATSFAELRDKIVAAIHKFKKQ